MDLNRQDPFICFVVHHDSIRLFVVLKYTSFGDQNYWCDNIHTTTVVIV